MSQRPLSPLKKLKELQEILTKVISHQSDAEDVLKLVQEINDDYINLNNAFESTSNEMASFRKMVDSYRAFIHDEVIHNLQAIESLLKNYAIEQSILNKIRILIDSSRKYNLYQLPQIKQTDMTALSFESTLRRLIRELNSNYNSNEKKVSIYLNTDLNNDIYVSYQLKEIAIRFIFNAVVNSVTHGLAQEIRISVNFVSFDERYHISVYDNGRGISGYEIGKLIALSKSTIDNTGHFLSLIDEHLEKEFSSKVTFRNETKGFTIKITPLDKPLSSKNRNVE